MPKTQHEVRDGIHGFITFNSLEKQLIDSEPFQRLRNIHQLAFCQHVYPGATHKRFEHSLGVMEIASRIFRSIFETRPEERITPEVRSRITEHLEPDQRAYWHSVVRIAALLHDLGHLPFSHAAEVDLLPEGWNHEQITVQMIRKSEIPEIISQCIPPINIEDVVDLCWDLKKRTDGKQIGPWKTLLNEIITGNTFGADRIDYLLRDSWHSGVPYGQFDPDRLIDSLQVVVSPDTEEISIAVNIEGIHVAEALLLARYFMFMQVYLHDVRRIYDIHLKEFLQEWLGKLPTDWQELLKLTDNEVLSQLYASSRDPEDKLHSLACRVVKREHFRTAYSLASVHKQQRPTIWEDMVKYATEELGHDFVRPDHYGPKADDNDFWVFSSYGSLASSLQVSGVIAQLPQLEVGFIFVDPCKSEKAKGLLKMHLELLLSK